MLPDPHGYAQEVFDTCGDLDAAIAEIQAHYPNLRSAKVSYIRGKQTVVLDFGPTVHDQEAVTQALNELRNRP